MSSQNNNKNINDHLDGSLSEPEEAAFQESLRSTPGLAEELQLWRDIDEATSDEGTLDFQRKVAEVGTRYYTGPTAKVRTLSGVRRYLAIAASVLILVSGGLFVYQQLGIDQVSSGSELYASHYTPYDISGIRLGSAEIIVDPFAQGIVEYDAGNYEQAAAIFEPLTKEGTNKMKATFALAHAYLNQSPSKTAEAEAQFRSIIKDQESSFVTSAQWYLALIYLQQEDIASAKPLLEAVKQSGGKPGKDAAEILSKLE